MINTEIGNARITLAFFYDEAERVSFNGGERFNSLMADRGSPGNSRPFSVQACFYPVSADSFSLSNVFLNDVIVGLCTFPGFQGQCFLASAGLGQRFSKRLLISCPHSCRRLTSCWGIKPSGLGVRPTISVAFLPTDFSYISIRLLNG